MEEDSQLVFLGQVKSTIWHWQRKFAILGRVLPFLAVHTHPFGAMCPHTEMVQQPYYRYYMMIIIIMAASGAYDWSPATKRRAQNKQLKIGEKEQPCNQPM